MILCRCGYEADDMADLARHITSWDNWAAEMGNEVPDLRHAED